MSYSITAPLLKKLYGQRLEIKTTLGDNVAIDIPMPENDWPRKGSEAYGLKVDMAINRNASREHYKAFLKLFQTEVPEREVRTRFLIGKQLAKKDICYHGVPFGWLGRQVINGVPVIAHFTRMISGPFQGNPEDFKRLRSTDRWDNFTLPQRRRHAGELVAAVIGLEANGIVHGDISPGNILFGSANAGDDLICILCDYDGFHAPGVPRLPRRAGSMMCRPLGSEGYQYPGLVEALARDTSGTDDIFVETDRFALGVAICEMIVWGQQVDDHLSLAGRGSLLSDSILKSRDISELPKEILDLFPDGFSLLDKALKAQDTVSLPTPEEWLQALGLRDFGEDYRGRPLATIYRRSGNQKWKLVDLRITNRNGKLSAQKIAGLTNTPVSTNFDIDYIFTENKLYLEVKSHRELKRRRAGKIRPVRTDLSAIFANPEDTIYLGDIEVVFSDVIDVAKV